MVKFQLEFAMITRRVRGMRLWAVISRSLVVTVTRRGWCGGTLFSFRLLVAVMII